MGDVSVKAGQLQKLHLHLSHGCGFSCRYDRIEAVKSKEAHETQFLPLSAALQAVQEAIPAGLQTVHLGGGDSLFHPELDTLLNRLESLELSIQLETNGAGLTPPRANRLASLPQSNISIALYGVDASTHDGYTAHPGAFDYATRAVRILSEAGLPVQIVYPVHRGNAAQIADLVKLVEVLGGDTIRFVLPHLGKFAEPLPRSNGNGKNAHAAGGSPATTHGHALPPDALHVEELIALSWRVERELAYFTPLHLVFEQPPAFRGLHPKARVDGQERCRILSSLSVTPTGEYTLCSLSRALPELTLGKVGENALSEIWASHPTLQMLRAGLPERLQGVCARCTMKSACLGECVVENKMRTGSFWNPGWFCEAAERVGLFPAGRLVENTW